MSDIETLREFIKEAGGPLAGDALDDLDRIAEALAEAEKALELYANIPSEGTFGGTKAVERMYKTTATLAKLRSLTNAKG